nr:U-actitoxin-Avd3f-like [Rhipicephalus microplus]
MKHQVHAILSVISLFYVADADAMFNEICFMPRDVGKCETICQAQWKWYYDNATGNCHPFMYAGFEGNNNRFRNCESCMHACDAKKCVHGTQSRDT